MSHAENAGFSSYVARLEAPIRRGMLELHRLVKGAMDHVHELEDRDLAEFAGGSYTPTLTGMAVGTGGSASNTGVWTYVGGPNVGDRGIIDIHIALIFGTSGQTFPTSPTLSLPSGFNFVSSNSSRPIGIWHMGDSGGGANNRVFPVFIGSADAFRPLHGSFTSAPATLTTTTPITWAAGDSMQIHLTCGVVRV